MFKAVGNKKCYPLYTCMWQEAVRIDHVSDLSKIQQGQILPVRDIRNNPYKKKKKRNINKIKKNKQTME